VISAAKAKASSHSEPDQNIKETF